LSPRENREIPPLLYDRVYRLKQDFPDLEIIINGGIKSLAQIQQHLEHVDGVMVGREAYANPMMLASIDQQLFGSQQQPLSPYQLIECYMPYVSQQLQMGVKLRALVRHLIGLFPGYPGSRHWRRYLSEHAGNNAAGVTVVENALACIGNK
jgi:tRNA-dihydrouridine synthase A